MDMKKVYLLLAAFGLFVPYYFFLSFIQDNGLNIQLLFDQLFANDISTFFAADLIITAVVLIIFIYQEGRWRRLGNLWIFLLATLLVGPSFSLPLFLYYREGKKVEQAGIKGQ